MSFRSGPRKSSTDLSTSEFLARGGEADPWGEGVAGWIEEDFRAYLRCGILAHGFARIRCDDCAADPDERKFLRETGQEGPYVETPGNDPTGS